MIDFDEAFVAVRDTAVHGVRSESFLNARVF